MRQQPRRRSGRLATAELRPDCRVKEQDQFINFVAAAKELRAHYAAPKANGAGTVQAWTDFLPEW